jgi:hypothetical protein
MPSIIDLIPEKFKLALFTLIVLAAGLGAITLLYFLLDFLWNSGFF